MKYFILLLVSLIFIIFSFHTFYSIVKQHDEIDRYKRHTTRENMEYMAAWFIALPSVFLWGAIFTYYFIKLTKPVFKLFNL